MSEPIPTADRGSRNPKEEDVILAATTVTSGRSIVAEGDLLITGTVITGDIGGDVHIHEAAAIEVPPPPEPERPPDTVGFVGRAAELAYYQAMLAQAHIAVIVGMVGMGKSALAAKLSQQAAEPGKLFWHTFHPGESIQAIIWKMAGFLARHGEDGLWQMLQRTQIAGGKPPPPEILFDYLYQLIRGKGYVLVFDDFEHVDEDPLVEQLADRLRQEVRAGEFRLILTSQRLPAFIQLVQVQPLGGMTAADTQALLAAQDVHLTAEQSMALHARTEGTAELLALAAQALKRAGQPERLIERLAESADIERFLLKEVDESLSEEDRTVIEGVSVLLGHPGTRRAIETTLDARNLRRQLRFLADRFLLAARETEAEVEYNAHAIVQAFYYDTLSRRQRQEMHCRAGEYYEADEPDALRAALHYERAESPEQAARLATADIWLTVNRGHGLGLLRLLERFRAGQLPAQLWAQVQSARGELLVVVGDGPAAQKCFGAALAALEDLPPAPETAIAGARACRGMGEALRHSAPAAAVAWFERGLALLGDQDRLEAAALYVKLGHARYTLGEFEQAVEASQEALKRLPQTPHPLRASALLNLGIVYGTQGNLNRALICYNEALRLSESLHDLWTMAKAWHNIGVEHETAGQWNAALTAYQRGLEVAEQLGSQVQKATLELSSGILAMKKGEYEGAQTHLERCLSLSRQYDLGDYLVGSAASLADLHLRRGEVAAADPLLAEAEQRALTAGTRWQLPEIYRLRGEWRLARREPEQALAYALQALALAEELELPVEAGIALRVMGQAKLTVGEYEAAIALFERSLRVLMEHDPYESARTQMQWGHLLLASGDAPRGIELLQGARTAFEKLGARCDLAAIGTIL
jgi:tetratricopeptide (TPR) repeat protein